MMFPVEIWQQIFLHTDPVTLMNLKTVCKCWKEIIDKILEENDHWYELCKEEIPECLWTTLCETLYPEKFYTVFSKKHAIWMAMYKLWMKCKNIVKCDTKAECFEPLLKDHVNEYITCADTKGSTLAIGTSEGYIYFYDIARMQKRADHVIDSKEYLSNIQLLKDDSVVLCISCSMNNHVDYWDVNKTKPMTRIRGQLVCTSYSYCCVSVHNILVIEGPAYKTMYAFGKRDIVAICASNNEVQFYTEAGYYGVLTVDSEQASSTYAPIQLPNVKIRKFYMFRPNIVMFVTGYAHLGILVQGKEWKVHNMFPVLQSIPTAVLVFGHVLVLGLESGNVHIYYIKDFEDIDFNSISSKKLYLYNTAVMALNMVVHREECLVVTYKKKIYTVKLL